MLSEQEIRDEIAEIIKADHVRPLPHESIGDSGLKRVLSEGALRKKAAEEPKKESGTHVPYLKVVNNTPFSDQVAEIDELGNKIASRIEQALSLREFLLREDLLSEV